MMQQKLSELAATNSLPDGDRSLKRWKTRTPLSDQFLFKIRLPKNPWKRG